MGLWPIFFLDNISSQCRGLKIPRHQFRDGHLTELNKFENLIKTWQMLRIVTAFFF